MPVPGWTATSDSQAKPQFTLSLDVGGVRWPVTVMRSPPPGAGRSAGAAPEGARPEALPVGELVGDDGQLWTVTEEQDVSTQWSVEYDEGVRTRAPAPLRAIGWWCGAKVGDPVTYCRELPVDGVHDYALVLSGITGRPTVAHDGRSRVLAAEQSWIHLAPGEGRELMLTVTHRPGAGQRVRLLRLEPVRLAPPVQAS